LSRDLDVVCFGEAIVDFFPERAGVPLAEVETFHRHLGGAPANVAVGLSRLGVRSALVTLVGADEFGRFARAQLSREGVDVTGVGTHPTARTAVTFVAVGPEGERTFTFYRHPSADMMVAPVDVDRALIARARLFHFGSSTLACEPARSATLSALASAREAGALVSCDPNFRLHLWADAAEAAALIRQTLADCDIVKLSSDELALLCGTNEAEPAAQALRERGTGLVIVSQGAGGCYFDGPGGSGHVTGERVPVVDVTGAGDGFMAGLLSALLPHLHDAPLAGLSQGAIASACARANRAGALTCTRFGAQTALPRKHEIE